MEEEILAEMIQDRETQIKMIKRKMEEQSRKMERVKTALACTKETYQTQHVENTMTLEKLYQQNHRLQQQLREAMSPLDMKKQAAQQTAAAAAGPGTGGAQLHLYNEVMKSISEPNSRDSSYVMRMQAQLCKAMHSMGMLETQLAMAQAHAGERQKHLKDYCTFLVEEKSQVELKLMNDLVMAGNASREVEDKHKEMITSFMTEKDALVEKIENQKEAAENDNGEDKENDEEEKEELQDILTQGREEIQRMTNENKQELAKLEELKAKVIAIRGEPFVNELLASIAEEFKDREEDDDEFEEEDEEED